MIDIEREIEADPAKRRHGPARRRRRAGRPPPANLRLADRGRLGGADDAERISRWFLPISGDYRLGGRYQLEGNAGGEILECDRPHLLRVSWVFGRDGRCGPCLRGRGASHACRSRIHDGRARAHRDRPRRVLGPVRTGRRGRRLGWGRSRAVAPLRGGSVDDPIAWQLSEEGREFFAQSSAAWGAAYEASGADPDAVAKAVANTTAFYAPEPQETPS